MIINKLKRRLKHSPDYKFREIKIYNKKIHYVFNEVLTDSKVINEVILKYFYKIKRSDFNNINNYIPNCNSEIIKFNQIVDYLNKGYLIVYYKKIYAFLVNSNLDRGVNLLNSELSIGGSKDSFNENIRINLGLIRKRIKSNLVSLNYEIGRISKKEWWSVS